MIAQINSTIRRQVKKVLQRPKQFFCLRGNVKSGTNWLGSLLSVHPHVLCLGEFHWDEVVKVVTARTEKGYLYGDKNFHDRVSLHFEDAIRRILSEQAPVSVRWIGERTPTTLGPVVLRDTPHITIMRDGRDVLISHAFHLYNRPDVTHLFRKYPEMAAKLESFRKDPWFFAKHPEQLLDNKELVCHSASMWRESIESDRKTKADNPTLPVFNVRYEELHRELSPTICRALEFLGADPELLGEIPEELLPGFKQERPNAFYRKGQVGDWVNYFTDQSRDWFKADAGEELIRQGYTNSDNW